MGLFNYSSKLSDEQLRRISLSAQYQGQQGGDHFTLSSKIGSRAKVLLEQGWGITDRQELCDTIEELLGRCRSLDIAVNKRRNDGRGTRRQRNQHRGTTYMVNGKYCR